MELSVQSQGGHSSVPPLETTVGILAKAINNVEVNQLPATITRVVAEMFDSIGTEFPFYLRILIANKWLFEKLIVYVMQSKPATNASLRTTTAPTMLMGGTKENVLAKKASAVINFRTMPEDSQEYVISHVKNVINDDRVDVSHRPNGISKEASPISR